MRLNNGIAYLMADEKLEVNIKGLTDENYHFIISNKDERWNNLLKSLFDNFSLKLCGGGLSCDVLEFTEKNQMIRLRLNYDIGAAELYGTLENYYLVEWDNFPWRS